MAVTAAVTAIPAMPYPSRARTRECDLLNLIVCTGKHPIHNSPFTGHN